MEGGWCRGCSGLGAKVSFSPSLSHLGMFCVWTIPEGEVRWALGGLPDGCTPQVCQHGGDRLPEVPQKTKTTAKCEHSQKNSSVSFMGHSIHLSGYHPSQCIGTSPWKTPSLARLWLGCRVAWAWLSHLSCSWSSPVSCSLLPKEVTQKQKRSPKCWAASIHPSAAESLMTGVWNGEG